MSSIDVNGPSAVPADTAIDPLFRKIAWRLMPFLSVCYLIAQIDRTNISFAKIEMLTDLNFSDTIYGLGAGIFFLGYCLFEVPANMILKRIGARMWLAILMFVWGLVSTATMFITTPASFYAMRFVLGVAEAGFFPGTIYYMTFWFTPRQRGRMTALFMASIALSGFIVGPISGAILHGLGGVAGLKGWQWIFALEGVPAMLLGILCWFYLDSGPEESSWLTHHEKALIARVLQKEYSAPQSDKDGVLKTVLLSPAAWGLSFIYACYGVAFYGVVFWLPTIVKATGVNDPLMIGLLTAIPWGVSVVVMLVLASYADRKQNSRKVLVALSVVSAAGFALTLAANSTAISLLGLTIAMAGNMASLPILWNLPTRLFQGYAAGVVIALIASIGNFPGFFAPYLVGWARDHFGSMDVATYMFIGAMLLAWPLLRALPQRVDPDHDARAAP